MKQNSKLQPQYTQDFSEIFQLIQVGKNKVYQQINTVLIDTYWNVGEYLSKKAEYAGWGKGVVQELADWLAKKSPDIKGFSASNLWRMKQFYDTYAENLKLAALLREMAWSKHLLIMARCKTLEEREFYLRTSIYSNWSLRELDRQVQASAFERTMLADKKLSPVIKALSQNVAGVFKDSYILDFLDLPEKYEESDLQSALLKNLCRFLMELGKGFTFVGEKIKLQVGNSDFELDLLFYHRELQCLVAFELKTGKFEPSHLGQLSFYLEALDRDYKKPHENPSIGVLLCRDKDDEVVEYALNRTMSPTLVSEYEHKLIPKEILKQKMHEWTALIESREDNA